MRVPVLAVAVVAAALTVAGCGAPDYGDEPTSYSSNWPHADPTTSESGKEPSSTADAEQEPALTLPNSVGGEVRENAESNEAGLVDVPVNGTVADAAYGSGSRTLTLYVYGGPASVIKRVARAHKKELGGSRVGQSTCATKSSAKVCWRASSTRVVSVTGSAKRSMKDLAAATDDAWQAQ